MITALQFAEKYSIRVQVVYVNHFNKSIWTKKIGGQMFVDEDYLIEVQSERRRLWLVAHDYYYYFIYVLGVKQTHLAKQLSKVNGTAFNSWNTYMSEDLFANVSKSITDTTIGTYLKSFVEICEKMIVNIHKKMKQDEGYLDRLEEMK